MNIKNNDSLLDKVQSKYLLVMIAAKRSKQLSKLEQKQAILNDDPEKLKGRPDLDNIGLMSDAEKVALSKHKPILVALDEILEDQLEWRIDED